MAAGDVDVRITTLNGRAGAVFDGVDDDTLVSPTILSNLSEQTICAWIKTRNDGGDNHFQSYNGKMTFSHMTDGTLRAEMSGTDSQRLTTTNVVPFDTWTHVIMRINYDLDDGIQRLAADADIFISGIKEILTRGVTGTSAGTQKTRVVGAINTSSNFYKGALSDVQYYNRALTDAECLEVSNGKILSGLENRYKFDTDYTDSAGSEDLTNDGSYLSIVDDSVASQISGQRIVGLVSGAYMITGLKGGQIASIAVTE